MFYYAAIDSEYLVTNVYSLETASTNENYIPITEEQYTSGNLVGQYYNSLLNIFEVINMMDYMGNSNWMTHKDTQMLLSTKTDNMEAEIDKKADINHTHTGYASQSDLEELEDIVDTKAGINHAHTEYAPSAHTHSEYATQTYVDEAVATKANSSHTHVISDITSLQTTLNTKATQTSVDAHTADTTVHITSTERNNWNTAKTHADSAHAPSNAEANQNAFSYVKIGNTSVVADSATDTLTLVAGSNVTLTPDTTSDSITISATDTNTTYSAGTGISLSGTTFSNSGVRSVSTGTTNGTISVNTNGITTSVPVYGLGSAAYTTSTAYDSAGAASNALASAKTYADSVGVSVKNELLNGAGAAYDTLKELGDLIDDNADAIEALEAVAAGKANTSHAHAISDITNLQSTLDGKAVSSHGTHVSYSTTVPVMDGTASVGTASTVARSDHRHPTDTSRASQIDLDALETVVSGKANSSHTHTIANITNLQTTLDAKASSSHTHNVATTSSAGLMSTSDKSKLDGIASGANAYTLPTASSTLGGVKTTSTVTSSSGYTACPIIGGVPYYKDTNTTYSLSSFGVTATATELNYVDGVTSNVQTQLNNKASSGHTHSAATTSVNGFMSSTDKSKLDGIATGANAYAHPTYTARTGVPTANAVLSHGGTFTVTQPVCDATGHITALNTRTYTLPSDNNTDTKVTNTLATTTKAYVTGTTSATTNTGTQVFDTGVYLDTIAGKLTATTFNGTTYSGSGVATASEVKTYLGI